APEHPSIVEEDVEPAEGRDTGFDRPGHVGLRGHVAAREHRPPALPFDLRDRLATARLVDVERDDARTLASEEQRRRPAHPGPRARNQAYLVFETHAFPWEKDQEPEARSQNPGARIQKAERTRSFWLLAPGFWLLEEIGNPRHIYVVAGPGRGTRFDI